MTVDMTRYYVCMTPNDPLGGAHDPYRIYTRDEAADFLRLSPPWLSELVKRGELYGFKSGKRLLFPRAALEAFIRGERFDPLGEDDGATFPATPSMFNGRLEDGTDNG